MAAAAAAGEEAAVTTGASARDGAAGAGARVLTPSRLPLCLRPRLLLRLLAMPMPT